MALQINSPYIRVEDANGLPYVGALLYIYLPETTTLASVFTNEGLSIAAANPATSDAKGEFPRIYIAAGTYKLRAEQKPIAPATSGTLIFEEDNIDTGLSAGTGALPISRGGTGATTAAAARANLDVPSNSELSDLADDIASLQSSIQNIVAFPQGYLTPTSGTPVISTGVVSGTALYYTPLVGNLVPIYSGSGFTATQFAELTLTLNSNHVANNIYDVFIFSDAGTLRLGTGPAWNTATAGSGVRGSGAGTTEVTRAVGGILTNANAITVRNGATTYSVAANQGTFVGSVWIDGTNGQITCHTAYGQTRKWAISNAYNRKLISLRGGDATSSWNYTSTSIRYSNASASNKVSVFNCLAEERAKCSFSQNSVYNTNPGGSISARIGIGLNTNTAFSGFAPNISSTNPIPVNGVASFDVLPSLGINDLFMLEQSESGGTVFSGGESNCLMLAEWMA